MNLSDHVAGHIAAFARIRAAILEEACERALQGGEHGVSIRTTFTPTGYAIHAEVDPDVPYGTIHEHPPT